MRVVPWILFAGVVACGRGETPMATTPTSAKPREASPPAPAAPAPAAATPAAASGENRSCLGQPSLDAAGGMCEMPLHESGRYRDENLAGEALAPCSTDPMTGWFRDGRCSSGPNDRGVHVVCAEMTEAFLAFTKDQGNDLSTPAPRYGFPGLEAGDRWCLCAARWDEARKAGKAPKVVVDATHAAALRLVEEDHLRSHATAADAGS